MLRIAFLLAVVAGRVFAQRTPQTTAPPMSNGTVVLVSLFKPVYPLLARQANIYGEVSVALTVRPDGTTRRRWRAVIPCSYQLPSTVLNSPVSSAVCVAHLFHICLSISSSCLRQAVGAMHSRSHNGANRSLNRSIRKGGPRLR